MDIKIDHLSYTYNKGLKSEVSALDDVTCTIRAGEFVGLIGHTGSGKSTFIQLLNGLLKADSGTIDAGGLIVTDPATSLTEVRRRIGLVFQYPEYQLFEETVAGDVAYGPKNLGMNAEEKDAAVREAMALTGLDYDTFADRSPFELSGGEKRRAAIAGVLAMRPEVLVLDEPVAGLDPRAHDEILTMISDIRKKRGCTVILVSHDMDDIAAFCGHVLVLDRGRLAMDGSPGEVFSRPAELKSMGLGLPAAGELIYELSRRGVDTSCLTGNAASGEPGSVLTDMSAAADAIAEYVNRRPEVSGSDNRKAGCMP